MEEDKANILANKNGSTMVHITKEGMEQKQISIPSSVQEQAQIGAYFEQLDNLITLHQRQPPIHIRFDHLPIIFNNNYTTSSTCNTIFMKGVLTYANHHYQK